MDVAKIKAELKGQKYNFLKENEHLGKNIILLGLGGSYAYGTNNETSDLDIRGCALNRKHDILTNQNFEQVVCNETDTTIYSFNKLVSLLSNCNPNVIEMLGLKPEHYLYLSSIGQELLDNKKLFLSKKAVHSFGGYANAQLWRLSNKAAREVDQSQKELHIYKSIANASHEFKRKYFEFDDDSIKLYVDKSSREDFETEIFMDVHLTHYPLRDYKSMWSEMHNIVKDYAKIGARNQKAVEKDKLSKHMMHLVRLYLMCFDILENQEIITYREKDHGFLMDIRNGKFLNNQKQPTQDFFEMIDEFEKRLQYDAENTDLNETPDYHQINEFVASVNERVVRNEEKN